MTMPFLRYTVAVVIGNLLLLLTATAFQPILRLRPDKPNDPISLKIPKDDYLYCDSWRYVVETNDAAPWKRIPTKCTSFVIDYVTGERYLSDLEAVADQALVYAKSVKVAGYDGKDVWVFDIDETLLSNIPWYAAHGFGSEIFDEKSFNDWVQLAEAPAIAASMRLYQGLQELGFTIILLTGRDEFQRNCTEKNLQYVGFRNWERLFLRGHADMGKPATIYKSEKRTELTDEGFRIHGNSGDQWSDLIGFAVARRSFKLPNPLYYIS